MARLKKMILSGGNGQVDLMDSSIISLRMLAFNMISWLELVCIIIYMGVVSHDLVIMCHDIIIVYDLYMQYFYKFLYWYQNKNTKILLVFVKKNKNL